MCPACLGMAALVVAGAVSTGGLAAVAGKMRRLRSFKTSGLSNEVKNSNSRRENHGKHQNNRSESGVAS
jgi:hypothetical protein